MPKLSIESIPFIGLCMGFSVIILYPVLLWIATDDIVYLIIGMVAWLLLGIGLSPLRFRQAVKEIFANGIRGRVKNSTVVDGE
jgi:hypothetical protein